MAPAESLYPNSKTVCVMDASGTLGSTLVERLLQRGYTVHAAVQNHGESQPLKKLGFYSKKLKIFRSDPFDYHSIVIAVRGCSGLFYTFEPPQDHATYDEFMADVEVRAAHNVLEACAQTDTIEKVVFTSSVTAVIWTSNRKSSSKDFDERNWSEPNYCRSFKLWHALSKTLAEKTAWALAMDRGVTMVSVNAGLLTAPGLSITNPYLKGAAEMYGDGVFVAVDLKFLVEAHICVLEDVATYGRYLCFNHVVNGPEDAFKLAQMLTPDSASTQPQRWDDTKIVQEKISNKKLNKLMVDFDGELHVD